MITDKDIKKLSSVFATKKDLEKFATKEDLQLFATKEDLEKFVTKSEFNEFKFELFNILDGIAKSIDDLKMEYVAIKMQLDRHERWIKELAAKTGLSLKE